MGRRRASEAIDWGPIKREYCLGQVTVRQLAANHEINPATLVRKAKEEGWVRDKRQEVKALSDTQLLVLSAGHSHAKSPDGKSTPTPLDIAAAATVRTTVILAHRRDAGRARNLAMTMMAELEAMTAAPMVLKDLQDCMRACQAGGEIPADVLLKADGWLGQALTLDNRAGILKSLSESLTKVVCIEREAFGINDPTPPAPGDPAAGAFSDFSAFKQKFYAAVAQHQGSPA